jgi:hypothetical protein
LLQAFVRLVALKRLGVLLFVLAATLCASSTASALEPAQTKTRVWDFQLPGNNSSGLLSLATGGKHEGNRLAQSEVASGSLLAAEGEGLLGGLADDALVCRGGTCTAERFANGSGVTSDAAGRLSGVSVNAGTASFEDLTATLRYKQVGVSTAGEVRAAGGVLTPAGSSFNPFHHELSGLTGEQLEQLFMPTIRNPNF